MRTIGYALIMVSVGVPDRWFAWICSFGTKPELMLLLTLLFAICSSQGAACFGFFSADFCRMY